MHATRLHTISAIRDLYARRYSEFGNEVGRGPIVKLVSDELGIAPVEVEEAILATSVRHAMTGQRPGRH